MCSTYIDLHVHIVFSTKHRQPWIDSSWRGRLYAYMAGTVRGLAANAVAIGGTEDHVHLLVALRATHAVADIVRELKKSSTTWVREAMALPPFAWQDGYAAFAVCADAKPALARYIDQQVEHHRAQKQIEELRFLLAEAAVPFDPTYME